MFSSLSICLLACLATCLSVSRPFVHKASHNRSDIQSSNTHENIFQRAFLTDQLWKNSEKSRLNDGKPMIKLSHEMNYGCHVHSVCVVRADHK